MSQSGSLSSLGSGGNIVSNVTTTFSTAQFTGTTTKNINFGIDNLLIGSYGASITGGATLNVGYGAQALRDLTSGVQNTAIGYNALVLCQDGYTNTAVGTTALQNCVSGYKQTAVGQNCLNNNTAHNNTCVGAQSMQNVGVGTDNSCLGYLSGASISDGVGNVSAGALSLLNLLTGSYNISLGYTAGSAYTGAETGNIVLNNVGVVGESNVTRIGNGTTTKCFVAGISGVTVAASVAVLIDANGQMGTILSSERYKENISDMPEDVSVLSLRPIKFNYKSDDSKVQQFGLLAEDVARDFPYLAVYKDGHPETVKYHELCVFLLAEIKRLEKRVTTLEGKS